MGEGLLVVLSPIMLIIFVIFLDWIRSKLKNFPWKRENEDKEPGCGGILGFSIIFSVSVLISVICGMSFGESLLGSFGFSLLTLLFYYGR
jgi:hypothetical protein